MFSHLMITKRISKKVTLPKWVKDNDPLYHERENSQGTRKHMWQKGVMTAA